MKEKNTFTYFRLLLVLLFVFIVVIIYAIWSSQEKVNVIDKELKQKQINQ